jgi:hypothetical protein
MSEKKNHGDGFPKQSEMIAWSGKFSSDVD